VKQPTTLDQQSLAKLGARVMIGDILRTFPDLYSELGAIMRAERAGLLVPPGGRPRKATAEPANSHARQVAEQVHRKHKQQFDAAAEAREAPKPARKKYRMSAAGRKALAEGQRKRWAKYRAEKAAKANGRAGK